MSRSPTWAFMQRMDLRDRRGNRYLTRWRLFECPLFGIYLHRIWAPDPGRDLHDHPWPFVSVVLSGSYTEEIPHSRVRAARWLNLKRTTDLHRIKQVYGSVWTLVFRGPRVRTWGFQTPAGWVAWSEYDDMCADSGGDS